jgi:hypothetical protein
MKNAEKVSDTHFVHRNGKVSFSFVGWKTKERRLRRNSKRCHRIPSLSVCLSVCEIFCHKIVVMCFRRGMEMADSLEYWGFGGDCGRPAGRGKFVSLRFCSVCTE